MFKVIKDIQLSKNFKLSEFVCKEGKNEVHIDMKLIDKLQQLRELLDKPVSIVSGYRSPAYNKLIGGATDSRHMYGDAADIKVTGIAPIDVALAAEGVGFDGIGVYDTWTHVDTRGYKARWGDWTMLSNATYEIQGATDIAWINPMDLKFAKVNARGKEVAKAYRSFINFMFYGEKDGKVLTVGTGFSEGRKITTRLEWDNVARGTFIIHKDGKVTIDRFIDPDKSHKDIWFCVQGLGLNPINLKAEWQPEGVGRVTNRIMLGYNPQKNKIVATYRPDTDIQRGRQTLVNLGCVDSKGNVLGIGGDSGTPATMVQNGKVIRLAQYLDNIIFW